MRLGCSERTGLEATGGDDIDRGDGRTSGRCHGIDPGGPSLLINNACSKGHGARWRARSGGHWRPHKGLSGRLYGNLLCWLWSRFRTTLHNDEDGRTYSDENHRCELHWSLQGEWGVMSIESLV